jgi:hypothetical protein
LAAAATSGGDGVLARNTATGHFEILSDADLQSVIDQELKTPKHAKPANVICAPAFEAENSLSELSLVSTLALKKILKEDSAGAPVATESDTAGFNPYDRG